MIKKSSGRLYISLILSAFLLILAGCAEANPVCAPVTGTPQYLHIPPDQLPTPTPSVDIHWVMIGRNEMQVDKLVEGPLCNDQWSGTVYVSCDVQVYPWTESPTFLKDCQLEIKPQTVVYVADHNDTAYYNGCSCHTGVTPEP